jgi:uncharacterized protein
MKIVLFGATGNVGRRIATEALNRGHEVIAVVRDPAQSQAPDPRLTLVQGDATDAAGVGRAAQGVDVVVSAISPRPGAHGKPAPSLASAAQALMAGTKQAGVKRLVVVGGAGTLEVAPGVQLIDTPGFPEAYKAEAQEHCHALAIYRDSAGDLDWTVISPAADFHPGERTGTYRTSEDQLLVDQQGQSHISFEDYAVALVDELERPKHPRQRFAVAY